MKIGVAQTRPVKGDIQTNISNHLKILDRAVLNGTDAIFFPELSLTGYEPGLAKVLATEQDDSRLDDFQKISDSKNITIGVGMPTKAGSGILISMIIFQPYCPAQTYSKQYLHPDELPYFVNGHQQLYLNVRKRKIAPAICYELSVPEHADNATKNGAEIYLATVAKTFSGAEKAQKSLSGIAKKYSMITLMSNCVGLCDGFECGGQ
ncbi:MAG TPA: carbon-nitrogen hydrolase family protein, partial [Chitinophagaceae bacterium]|nr:carbon-nitrogen hydrolase family protein [Chitinophagaceae bacterium]